MKLNSFLGGNHESGFLWANSGGYRPPNHYPRIAISDQRSEQRIECGAYSAAAANEGLTLADDTMKSEIRGTISDLKREPLKTP